jgi:hypothetical protein
MTNEKYETCFKTNNLNFGHIHGLNKKIMTVQKLKLIIIINQSQESICTNILSYVEDKFGTTPLDKIFRIVLTTC